MSLPQHIHDELCRLFWAFHDDSLSEADATRLRALMLADSQAREMFVRYSFLCGSLEWDYTARRDEIGRLGEDNGSASYQTVGADANSFDHSPSAFDGVNAPPPISDAIDGHPPVIVVGPSASSRSFAGFPAVVGYFSQIGPFSYLVSALLMCVAVLSAWQYEMVDDREAVRGGRAANKVRQAAAATEVASVTGMSGCRWGDSLLADNEAQPYRSGESNSLSISSRVSLGRRIHLASGLLEIGFGTGAKVILQGPATFEVEHNGGFLAVGKLTGRLEKPVKKPDSQSRIPNSSTPFVIRTPSAVITDLSTEFGVEVNADGHTASYVFRGSVEVQSVGRQEEQIVLHETEAVVVRGNRDRFSKIARVNGDPSRFVRRVPKGWIPIEIFGTGSSVRDGKYDPHWRIVARSDDPAFKAQDAMIVSFSRPGWPSQTRCREKWISTDLVWNSPLPPGETYTFRTTFHLEKGWTECASVRGRFCADKCVRAVRLNGKQIPFMDANLKYDWERGAQLFHGFTVDHGFIAGANVLEIDVEAGEAPETPSEMAALGMKSALGLVVALEGWAQLPQEKEGEGAD